MTGTSADQMRAPDGPAVLSYGFRPFFLAAGLWAAIAMALWIGMLSGAVNLPTDFDPVSWHAHEMLFGYLGAVVAGFLLTAVPNWTGREPIIGWPLASLALLWLLGRIAVAASASMPPGVGAALDLVFPMVLAMVILREILASKNWRNLIVVAMLGALILANGLFHWEAAQGGFAAQGYGLRIGLAAAVMMISVIGGRIIPAFTRNWLAKQGSTARPAVPAGFDKMVLILTLAALVAWIIAPKADVSGFALFMVGILQAVRLGRWASIHTAREPLVWILHVGYAFVPIGALALSAAILWPDASSDVVAQHIWMAGAVGVMTLAVMTRAILGHTGQPLTAGHGTVTIYLTAVCSIISRILGGVAPEYSHLFYMASGVLWCAAFLGFTLLYGRLILRRRKER